MNFELTINEAIKNHKVKKYQLGKKMNRPTSYISGLTNRKRDIKLSTLLNLSNAIGCDIKELYKEKSDTEVKNEQ